MSLRSAMLTFMSLSIYSAYRTVAGVNGPLVILDQVKVSAAVVTVPLVLLCGVLLSLCCVC